MRTRRTQQGSLMIAAVVMIVILGFMATTLTSLVTGNSRAAVDDLQTNQAFFLAESGLERGIRRWQTNPAYTGEGPVAFGAGTFTITVDSLDFSGATLTNPAQKHLRSTGTVTGTPYNHLRTSEAIVQSSMVMLNEPFPNLSNWGSSGATSTAFCPAGATPTAQYDNGEIKLDKNAPGSSGSALYAKAEDGGNGGEKEKEKGKGGGGSGGRLTGYRQTTLGTTIAANTSVILSLNYYTKIENSGAYANMGVDFVATDGTVYRLWTACTTAKMEQWRTAPVTNWTVPAGKTINRVRLAYDLQKKAAVAFDDILIRTGNGSIVSWQERPY